MRTSRQHGFSLVEVVLALAVMAFSFVAILGLIPAGMSNFRQSINLAVGSQIAQRIIGDAFQSDYDILTTDPKTGVAATGPFNPAGRYFDEEGNELQATDASAIYYVNTRIYPNTPLPGTTSTTSQLTLVTVEIAFNPARVAPTLTNNLIDRSKFPARNIATYFAEISKNQ